MESSSCLSTSSSPTQWSLPVSFPHNQSLPSNHSHPIKRLNGASDIKTKHLAFNPPSPESPSSRDPARRQRIVSASEKMRELYPQNKYCSSFWSPELRFAMKATGRASNPSLTIQDLVQGKDVFRNGLSQLPEPVFRKIYIAKRASRDCILSRLSATLRELDALEKMKDVILEMHKQGESELAAINKDLGTFKDEAESHGDSIDDDIIYRHAVYAEEFMALVSTNTQLDLMLDATDPELTSDESESVVSNEFDEDALAEADEE